MNQRVNEQIRISPVRVIDHEGVQRGIMPTEEAFRLAQQVGMDLVEVSPNERPPVCKIMDYGKAKYLKSKKTKQKQHEQKLKEVRLRPKTDPHDKEIKLRNARRFLEHGDKVLFSMRFKGRERFHREVGMAAMQDIAGNLTDIGKVEQEPRMLGPRMTMTVVPIKAKPTTAVAAKPPASAGKSKPSEPKRQALAGSEGTSEAGSTFGESLNLPSVAVADSGSAERSHG